VYWTLGQYWSKPALCPFRPDGVMGDEWLSITQRVLSDQGVVELSANEL